MHHTGVEIKVPFVDLSAQHRPLMPQLLEAVERVISGGMYILGPDVSHFERIFADFCGVRHAVGVDNGTNALLLSLRALGIGPGDEVITAPNSFLASASCIALAGARPVFADVREDYNIDPAEIAKAITPRTKAIIPVHLTGRPADMGPICRIAEDHGLHIVEDCAQATGAQYRQRRVGSFGITGCFSFHPLKVLNAIGDGGMITTNNSDVYEALLKYRNNGLRNRDECDFWSINSRLDAVQAAMLTIKMNYLPQWIEARRAVATYYRNNLADIVTVPYEQPDTCPVYQTFIIQSPRRDDLQDFLATRGIETKIHYPVPIHLQAAARELKQRPGTFPQTENQAKSILSLPIYPDLTTQQMEHVTRSIRQFHNTGKS